ncbi:23S rRNA (uracil(1939)-C(5))-methyltransferase RlmD [Paenibacillus sp. TRM 82003]|nr:23S rRNA (uracil(1939)-C(5))-methyltransferase RlmD [Paenibacillus sp. TRM 82003]
MELSIVGLAHEGEGVGRVEGFTLFVPGALPGETVRARVGEVKKQFGRADLLEVLVASPDRVAPPCAVYSACGGCQLQHFAYDAQLRWKRQLVVDALERIGKLRVAAGRAGTGGSILGAASDKASPSGTPSGSFKPDSFSSEEQSSAAPLQGDSLGSAGAGRGRPRAPFQADSLSSGAGIMVHPVIGMDEPWRYRNKAQVPIGFDLEEGGLVGGFYAQGSHRIVDMDQCLIQHERNDDAVLRVKRIARELGIEAYDEKSHTGWLRHVVVKVSFATGDMMVVLVGTSREAHETHETHEPNETHERQEASDVAAAGPHLEAFIAQIREALPHVVSICLNVNSERTSNVFGLETSTIWGADVIHDEIGGIRFAISARSFYQVNPTQTETLYAKALEYAALSGDETVIDAYCGIGTISLFLARAARHVYGVELIPDAVKDARANARLNDIDNADFEVGRAEVVLPAWRGQGIDADVIVVDPPRKGCDPALLDTLVAMKPERVVYVSCNPATLARDLAVLEAGGFRTVEIQPVDMFPHTGHVEAVCLLTFQDRE